jgi:PAS domain S-box-containing protein
MSEQTQETWQKTEARFRALTEGVIQGILMHRNFVPLFANQALATLFGYASPEALLRLESVLQLFTPHEQARLQQFYTACRQGIPVSARYEVQGTRQDGTVLWLENATTVVEWDGAPALQTALVDLTARKRAEAALEVRVSRLRTLMRLNRLVSLGLDVDRVLQEITWAAATLTGATVVNCWMADETVRTLEVRAFSDERFRANFPGTRLDFGQAGVGWVAAQRRPLNAPDVFADPRLRSLGWWQGHGLRSFFALPILFEGALLGVLALYGPQPFHFAPEDQELLDSFVAQAAVAIRNARLYRESEEQRQRLATFVDVTQRLTRGLELPTVLQAIAEAAAQVFGGEAGFRLLEGEELVRAATTPGARQTMVRERVPVGESLSGAVAVSRQPCITADSAADARLLPEHRAALDPAQHGAFLCVPVQAGECLLGTLHIYRERGYRFGPEALQLARSLADQAAIAIDNARLYGEALEQTARLEALTRTSARVASTQQIDELLRSIAEEAAHLLRVEGSGFRLLQGDRLVVGSTYGIARHVMRQHALHIGQSLTGWVAQIGCPLAIPDIREDPLPLAEHRDAALEHGVVAYLGVPLRYRNRLIGVLNVYSHARHLFQEREVHLLSAFADQAAIAIEHLRLLEEARAQAGELAQANSALRDSEERYRQLVELSPDAIFVQRGGEIVFVNTAGVKLLGAERPAELLGRSVLAFVPPEYRELVQTRLQQLQENGKVPCTEEKLVRLDGQSIDVEVALTATTYMGQPAIQTVIRDITARKRLEARLRQAHKMEAIGTLAGGIAHDFNNILAAILGYTELALYDVAKDSLAAHNLNEVLAASQRARSLVQQILAFSRQGDVERRPVQLHLLVKEALTLLRASLPTTITICQHLTPFSDTILADPTQMHQVLLNLCANAEYAMRATGGELEVRLEPIEVDGGFAVSHPPLQPGPHVRLTVRDTGPGMPPDVLERIFEPFFTTKGVGEGTGMGLAMVHGIITSHDGAITVESAVGQGTTFAVYLPRLSGTAPSMELPVETLPAGGTECILLVDDEASLVHLGQELLTRLGYQVVVCTSSVEALETFRAAPQRFDLVITDQTMPKLTGEALVCELRRLRPDIPIILCTGFSHTMTEEKARALGLNAFLMKPLVAQELSQVVRQVLAERWKENVL